jgi:hypothetical protein
MCECLFVTQTSVFDFERQERQPGAADAIGIADLRSRRENRATADQAAEASTAPKEISKCLIAR